MHIHDVLIVGAGPCGLAMAARLREQTPSATFTDDEHQRYHWIRKHGKKMNIKNWRTQENSLPTPPSSPETSDCGCDHSPQKDDDGIDMLILDADGADWMTKWHRLFKTFGIVHLRSPMFFHVDPSDRDALLGYTYEMERDKELYALPGCVGKEVSKHRKKKKRHAMGRMAQSGPFIDERDRKDYFTPSTKLFAAHCEQVSERYGLGPELIRNEKVVDIEYDELSAFQNRNTQAEESAVEEKKVFKVTTDEGSRFARIVILAVGPGNAPSIPKIPGLPAGISHSGFSHAMYLKHMPPPQMMPKIKSKAQTNMLIIGGGLTTIQIADLAIQRGVSKVWILMRGPLKIKYFDMDLDWVGKFRNFNQAAFWSADTDEERLEMYLEARNGGSVTPRYRKVLENHMNTSKIMLNTFTTLESTSWNEETQSWKCSTSSSELTLPPIDHIVFATGVQTDTSTMPFMQSILRDYPIEIMGGFPCLTDDLMWSDEVPLFASGRLAALRLGPGAPNLVGARIGAERIAWNVQDLLDQMKGREKGDGQDDEDGEDSPHDKLAEYAAARRNRFDSLVGTGEDE